MKPSHIIFGLSIWLILSTMGCIKQKLAGDDDINLIKAKKAEINATGIKEAEVDVRGILGAQIGLINETLNDMRNTASGRDSIQNETKPYVIVIIGQTIIIILLSVLGYLSKRKQLKNSDSRFNRLMDAIHNNPNEKLEKVEKI